MSQSDDLGPQPDAQIEPGEPAPGGVDAVPQADGVDNEHADPDPVSRDLDPDDNPAVEESLPEEMRRTEDTSTAATEGEADDVDSDEESPA